MAVLGRLLISSGERLDLPDLLSVDSYTAGDFKYLLKGLVGGTTPYILKGFDVIDPQNAIGTQSCSIRVADSAVFYPGSSAGSFFYGLEEGHPQATPLVPELRKNAVNYVYLTFSTTNTSVDTRAFWDPDKDGGNGGEFTQDVNTESVLQVQVNVSVGSFPQNTIPIAKITVGPVVITAIEDARDMLFRLGTGGISPNPFNSYSWKSLPSSSYKRAEPPTKILAGGVNPFQGADKNIYTLKEWMDTVMSKLQEIGGTVYWYEDTSTYSLISGFIDAVGTAFKSKGKWLHDSSVPGLLTWTEDLQIKITADPRTYIVRSGSKTLSDEQVMYLPMVRRQPLNAVDDAVDWINGQPYINTIGGAVGLFANLSKGDYVKKINDSNDKFLRVEEFYDSISLGGSTTTAALAKSVRLSSNYLGTTVSEKGRYDKGVYSVSDVLVSDRNQTAISNIGGNFHWMALRSDTIQSVASISTTALTVDIEEHDGTTAKVISTGAHGLVDGDRVTISSSTNFDGTYVVEVESSTVFYIQVGGGPHPDESGADATYATVTTAARSTLYGLQLESANHSFQTNDTVIVSGTTNYNGSHLVSRRSATSFTIPVASALGSESVGLATLARTVVRTEGSVVQIVQGGSADIGGDSANNIKQFIGMQSLSETNPSYSVPPSYNSLDGQANYNSSVNESLTSRVSKLTAMMADKAQDKTIKLVPSGYRAISNLVNGTDREITFLPFLSQTPRVDVVMPGSDDNGSISLGSSILLGTNQAAYFQVDRNNTFTVSSLTVADISSVPIEENTYIFALRLSTNEVWLWDGLYLAEEYITPIQHRTEQVVRQNRTLKLVRGGQWTWDLLNTQLQCSSDAYIQIPGLPETTNTISAGLFSLPADGDVLYVEINREAVGVSTLTVNTSSISTLDLSTLDDNVVIIARRIGDDVIVGSDSMILHHGEYRILESSRNEAFVAAVDNVSAVLPSGASVTVDGIGISDGDLVLFTMVPTSGIYMASGIGTAATWTFIDAFNIGGGGVPTGAVVVAENGSNDYLTRWVNSSSGWKQAEHDEVTKEPTGFPNRTDSFISFVGGTTRQLTIAPTGTEFDLYQKGRPWRFNGAQTVTIPDVEGIHYVYFDNGSFTSTNAFTIDILKEYVFIATIQWDATNSVGILVGDERHGLTMDGETHSYLHQSLGTRHINGLSAGGFTTSGTGNANSDAQLSISDGRIRDEDIAIDIVDSPTPTAEFEQILDPIAQIPVFYRSGVNGDWRKDTATQYPVKPGTGVIKYNNPAGPWTTPDATSGNFVAMWIFATNSITEPVIAIMGQRQDATLNDAQANNTYESLSFGTLPSLEMKVLYRLIFETSTGFSNVVGAALRDVRDLRKAIDVSLGSYAPSDHGLLSGLTDQDHPDYSIFVSNPSAYVGGLRQINVTDNDDVQKALESLDRFFAQLRMRPHPSNTNRVILSGADQALTNNITLSQVIKGLMMSFNGAQIDFSTGVVYASDGVTALGNNFTPATIAAGQYRWYSVNLVGVSPTNANNTVSAKLKIVTATADGASFSAAPRAKYASGGVKIGQVWVQQSGGGIAPITAANINQLGVGSGSGGDDIFEFDIVNNQAVAADVTDMVVDIADNRLFKTEFGIERVSQLVSGLQTSFITNATDSAKFSAYVRAVAVQSDGKTIVGGSFINYAGTIGRDRLVRLNTDGTLDTSFCVNAVDGSDFNGDINAIAIQTDGKILIGGAFTSHAGVPPRSRFLRLNSDGTVDSTFCANTDGKFGNTVWAIAIQTDGKILVGGAFDNFLGGGNKIVRLNSDGTVDSPFSGTIGSYISSASPPMFNPYPVRAIKIQTDGKILLGGEFLGFGGVGGRDCFARLNTNGTIDTAFCANASDSGKFSSFGFTAVHSIDLQSDGKILVGGNFTNYGGTAGRNHFIRLDSTGTLDTTFTSNSSDSAKFSTPSQIYAVKVQSDGKILVGGSFTNYASAGGRSNLIRVNSDGTTDTTFCSLIVDGKFFSTVYAVALDGSGDIVIGGDFFSYGGTGGRDKLIKVYANALTTTYEYITQGSFSGIYRTSLSNWEIDGYTYTGDNPEVTFTITSAGQVRYTSSNLPGTILTSKLKFKLTKL